MVNRAKGAVAEVESYIKETYLIAPAAGEVSEIFPKVGELVGTGAPIMNIAELNDMWVTFNVREDLLKNLTMGSEFEAVIPALDNKKIQLKVYYLKDLGTYAAWKATKNHRTVRSENIRGESFSGREGGKSPSGYVCYH